MIYTLEMDHIQLIHGSNITTVEVEATSCNEAMIKALQMDEYKDVFMNSIQAISVKTNNKHMKVVNLSKQEIRDLLALINNSDNECYDSIANKLTREPLYLTVLKAIDGRFGKKVLKNKYRGFWRVITYGTLAFMFFRFILCPFFAWWDKVVAFLNYVIWG